VTVASPRQWGRSHRKRASCSGSPPDFLLHQVTTNMLDITKSESAIAPAPNQIGGEHAPIFGARIQQHTLDQAREYLARVVPWPAASEAGYVTLAYTVPTIRILRSGGTAPSARSTKPRRR
jgi:hypothetical protein